MNTDSETFAAFNLGLLGAEPSQVPATPGAYVLHPKESTVTDLESLQDKPRRIRAAPVFVDAAAFVAYVKRFKGQDSVLFADRDASTILGLLDYHGASAPSWCNHRPSLSARLTKPWKTWAGSNKNWFSQVDFAEFLEANAKDVVTPSPAAMLEIALKFQAERNLSYSKGVRLSTGQIQLQYTEKTEAKGTIEVPEVFSLGLAPYEGTSAYKVEARLRWRIKETEVVFSYDMFRAEEILREAFQAILDRVRDETGIEPWHGAFKG